MATVGTLEPWGQYSSKALTNEGPSFTAKTTWTSEKGSQALRVNVDVTGTVSLEGAVWPGPESFSAVLAALKGVSQAH